MERYLTLIRLKLLMSNSFFEQFFRSSSASPTLINSEKQSNLLHSIQVLRGVAALMVVISHIGAVERKYGFSGQNLLARADIGQAGADLFFLISGFIMVVTMARRFGNPSEIGPFLIRRFMRIYPIYWVFVLVICLAQAVRPEWVNSSYPGETRYLTSFLLLPAPGVPVMMVAWTLEYEVAFYLIFAVLMFLPFRWLLPLLSLFFGLLVLFGEFVFTDGFWPGWAMRPILLEFLLGAALGHLHLQKRWGFGWLLTFTGIVLWVIATMGPASQPIRGFGDAFLERPISFGIPAGLLLYGLVSLEKKIGVKFPMFLQRLGDSSYSLYLSHVLVISVGGRLWLAGGFNQWPINFLLITVVLILALLVGWLIHVLIEKPLISFLQKRWLKDTRKVLVDTHV